MAALNITTADKIDALTESLWKATQEEVPQIVAHLLGPVSQDEMAFVWYAHKMMATDADNHEAVDSLFDEWEAASPSLSLYSEYGVELFWLADACIEGMHH